MTVQEYLAGLEAALGAMDKAERDDFLLEMESHIADLRERRPETEEETIVAGLTPPELLAAELAGEKSADQERAGPQGPSPDGNTDRRREGGPAQRLREALEFLGSLGTGVADLASRASLKGTRRTRGTSGSSEDFLRDFEVGDFSEARIELISADISVRPSEDAALHVRAEGIDSGTCLDFAIREGVLEIAELTDDEASIEGISLELPPEIGVLEILAKSADVDLEDIGCGISVTTMSGDIEIRACPGPLSVKSASGDIDLEDCGSASVSTASGDIDVQGSVGDLAAMSGSGDISIEEVAGRVGAETSSGEISISGVGGLLAAKTASGGISIAECPVPVTVSSSSGELDLDFLEGFSGANVATVSGDVSIVLSEDADATIRIDTKSGEVSVRGDEKPRGEIVLGTGEALLAVQGISGDVSVDW